MDKTKIGQLFDNNSDCYADTRVDLATNEWVEVGLIPAMTKERFIEVVCSYIIGCDVSPEFVVTRQIGKFKHYWTGRISDGEWTIALELAKVFKSDEAATSELIGFNISGNVEQLKSKHYDKP